MWQRRINGAYLAMRDSAIGAACETAAQAVFRMETAVTERSLRGSEDEWEFDHTDAAVRLVECELPDVGGQAAFDARVVHCCGFDRSIGDFAVQSYFPEDDNLTGEVRICEELLFIAVSEGIGAFLHDFAYV